MFDTVLKLQGCCTVKGTGAWLCNKLLVLFLSGLLILATSCVKKLHFFSDVWLCEHTEVIHREPIQLKLWLSSHPSGSGTDDTTFSCISAVGDICARPGSSTSSHASALSPACLHSNPWPVHGHPTCSYGNSGQQRKEMYHHAVLLAWWWFYSQLPSWGHCWSKWNSAILPLCHLANKNNVPLFSLTSYCSSTCTFPEQPRRPLPSTRPHRNPRGQQWVQRATTKTVNCTVSFLFPLKKCFF